MIHVVWCASVQHPKAGAAGNAYMQRARLLRLQLQASPTYWVSLPPRSWQTWKGLPGLGTMVTDAPCTQWLLRWGFGAEQCSLNLGSIPSPSLMECCLFSYLFSQTPPPPIHSVVRPHYPAKVVPSSKMAINHEDGIECACRPTQSMRMSHSWSSGEWFVRVFVLWLKTLQRKLMCALVLIRIISIYMAQGLQPNILPYIVCVLYMEHHFCYKKMPDDDCLKWWEHLAVQMQLCLMWLDVKMYFTSGLYFSPGWIM